MFNAAYIETKSFPDFVCVPYCNNAFFSQQIVFIQVPFIHTNCNLFSQGCCSNAAPYMQNKMPLPSSTYSCRPTSFFVQWHQFRFEIPLLQWCDVQHPALELEVTNSELKTSTCYYVYILRFKVHFQVKYDNRQTTGETWGTSWHTCTLYTHGYWLSTRWLTWTDGLFNNAEWFCNTSLSQSKQLHNFNTNPFGHICELHQFTFPWGIGRNNLHT